MIDIRARLAALAVIAALFALPVVALLWMTAVPGVSHDGPLPPLTAQEARLATRLRGHVVAIASTPHNVEHPIELERAARHIEGALAAMGYAVRRQSFSAGGERVRNIETPLMGSVVYAAQLKRSGEPVLGMISLETIGYYSDRPHSQHYPWPLASLYPDTGNFVAFVGTTGSRGFVRRTVGSFRSVARFPSVGGTAPGLVKGVDWSDHWAFAGEGMPALMVTDTAPFRYPHYHSLADTPDKIDYDRLARVVAGLDRTIRVMR